MRRATTPVLLSSSNQHADHNVTFQADFNLYNNFPISVRMYEHPSSVISQWISILNIPVDSFLLADVRKNH